MPLTDATKNTALDAVAAICGYASLHTGYPGTTGASEVAGGSPAYARKSITWNAAASGNLDSSNAPVFDVPAATTVAWFGLWSASSGGTFRGGGPLGAGSFLPFYAAASDDLLRVDAHGLSNGATVVVIDAGAGGVLPTGLAEGTIYYVRDVSGDTFKLAATSGGSAIDLTTDGAGIVTVIAPETFGSQGLYTLSDCDLALV